MVNCSGWRVGRIFDEEVAMKRRRHHANHDGYGFDLMSFSELLNLQHDAETRNDTPFDARSLIALRDEIEKRRREGASEAMALNIGGASADVMVRVK